MKKFLSVTLGALLIAPCFSVHAEETALTPAPSAEVIVKLENTSASAIAKVENIPGITVSDVLTENTIIVEASSTAAHAADILNDLPQVEYAEPSYSRMPLTLPMNDAYANQQWALENTGQVIGSDPGTAGNDIHAAQAWGLSYGTSTIVAVIDSGVLYTHPDLANNMWDGTNCISDQGFQIANCVHGFDFEDDDLDPAPVATSTSYAHGTHVAGIIAAEGNNGLGTVGVAPSAKIMALRFGFDTATEVRAIDFARLNGAKIINASYGGTQYSQAEYDAIKRFTDTGGIFVAAAGNTNQDDDALPHYPSAYDLPGIISVAATNQNDALSSFSNYGLHSVDLGAPGVNILSTYMTSSSTPAYTFKDGTSMAAPHVAGAVALIESLYTALSASDVKDAILSGGDSNPTLSGRSVSGKRLNAYTSLRIAGGADLFPPVITLTGSSTLSLNIGDAYTELGATAVDARDGTTTVSIGGDTVSTTTAGTYHVTYDAVDLAGNHAAQAVRTVTVNAVTVSTVSAPSGGGGGGGGGSSVISSSSSGGGGGGGGGSSSKTKSPKKVKSKKASVPRPALAKAKVEPAPVMPAPGVAAPAFTFVRNLSLGASGADVTALQNALTRAGVYAGPVTGYFGPLTQAAVKAYQAQHLLPQVGVIGPMTRALLNTGA